MEAHHGIWPPGMAMPVNTLNCNKLKGFACFVHLSNHYLRSSEGSRLMVWRNFVIVDLRRQPGYVEIKFVSLNEDSFIGPPLKIEIDSRTYVAY